MAPTLPADVRASEGVPYVPLYLDSPDAIERVSDRLRRMISDAEALPSTAALTERLSRMIEEIGDA